jgi:hypothetical protein
VKQINQRDSEYYITNRLDFRASALEGLDGRTNTYGRLDAEEVANYERVKDSIDYVVMSYRTPIAWHSAEGWYVVAQKFSVTTSKHQNLVRRAISSNLVVAQ